LISKYSNFNQFININERTKLFIKKICDGRKTMAEILGITKDQHIELDPTACLNQPVRTLKVTKRPQTGLSKLCSMPPIRLIDSPQDSQLQNNITNRKIINNKKEVVNDDGWNESFWRVLGNDKSKRVNSYQKNISAHASIYPVPLPVLEEFERAVDTPKYKGPPTPKRPSIITHEIGRHSLLFTPSERRKNAQAVAKSAYALQYSSANSLMEEKSQVFDPAKWYSTFPKVQKAIPKLIVQTLNDSFNKLECSDSFSMNMANFTNHYEQEALQVRKLDISSRGNTVFSEHHFIGGMKIEKGPEVSVIIIEAPEIPKTPGFKADSKLKGIVCSSISGLINNTAISSKRFRRKTMRSESLKAIKTEYSDNFIDSISGTTSIQHSGCPTPRRHTLTPVSNIPQSFGGTPVIRYHDLSGLEQVPEE
jgi:hypothetical protein